MQMVDGAPTVWEALEEEQVGGENPKLTFALRLLCYILMEMSPRKLDIYHELHFKNYISNWLLVVYNTCCVRSFY